MMRIVNRSLAEFRKDGRGGLRAGGTFNTQVRGSAFLRRGGARMVASHRRRLSPTGRNHWVGFRPGFLPGLA